MKGTTLAVFSTLLVLSSAALVENDFSVIADSKPQLQIHQNSGNSGKSSHFGLHSLKDVIAQASCSAYVSIKPNGWVYAVRRACISKDSCADICSSKSLQSQDQQTVSKTWRCIGAVHVYQKRPATGDGSPATLGLKTRYYGHENCNSAGRCGPNYCCCKVLK